MACLSGCLRMGESQIHLPPRCTHLHHLDRPDLLPRLYRGFPARHEQWRLHPAPNPRVDHRHHPRRHPGSDQDESDHYEQRFVVDGCEINAESDCRFCFFWEKNVANGEWRARFVRHWYEKDKLLPVNPNKAPELDERKLAEYPSGYRYLAYCQEKTMGIEVLRDMPGHRRENGNVNGQKHDVLYWQCKK